MRVLLLLVGIGCAMSWSNDDLARRPYVEPFSYLKNLCDAKPDYSRVFNMHLRRFDDAARAEGVPAEDRFELLVKNHSQVVRQVRREVQPFDHHMPETFAYAHLFQSAIWSVYGYAQVDREAIMQLVPLVAEAGRKWVDPYTGLGYFAMQLQNMLGIDMDAFDLSRYYHTHMTVTQQDARTIDYTPYNVFMLSYPCVWNDGCWSGLRNYTEQSTGTHVVYMGEPRGHCCAQSSTWAYLCQHWHLTTVIPITGGLPGSYNSLVVYERRDFAKPLRSRCEDGACDANPSWREWDYCG